MSQKATLAAGSPSDFPERNGKILGWTIFARLFLLAVYAQSIFAGVFLSGKVWGRDAHETNAGILVMVSFIAGALALFTLRDVSGGRRYAISMLALAVGITIQYAIGEQVADGERLLWLHIPFGVALIGWSAEMATVARRLGK
ncbi:MAG: hypothetical protein ACRDHN_00685 [Thermomicrobiales bacterium]